MKSYIPTLTYDPEAEKMIEDVYSSLERIEWATFMYYSAICNFMDAYAGDHKRSDLWFTYAHIRFGFRIPRTCRNPGYQTVKNIYYRINRYRRENDLKWLDAIKAYAVGQSKHIRSPLRSSHVQVKRRRAIRAGLPEHARPDQIPVPKDRGEESLTTDFIGVF